MFLLRACTQSEALHVCSDKIMQCWQGVINLPKVESPLPTFGGSISPIIAPPHRRREKCGLGGRGGGRAFVETGALHPPPPTPLLLGPNIATYHSWCLHC